MRFTGGLMRLAQAWTSPALASLDEAGRVSLLKAVLAEGHQYADDVKVRRRRDRRKRAN